MDVGEGDAADVGDGAEEYEDVEDAGADAVEDADADLDGTRDIKVSLAVTGTNIVLTRVAALSVCLEVYQERELSEILFLNTRGEIGNVISYIMIVGRIGHWTLDLTLCIIE